MKLNTKSNSRYRILQFNGLEVVKMVKYRIFTIPVPINLNIDGRSIMCIVVRLDDFKA